MLPFERTRTLTEAREAIESHIKRCGWTAEFKHIGTDIVTTICTIRDINGEIVNSGFGKGAGDVSTVGALYEAIEHHYGIMTNIDLKVECVSARDLYENQHFSALPFASELHRQGENYLGCAIFRDFYNGTPVRIPLFLFLPHYVLGDRLDGDDFDYSIVLRYASNSGTAIGATFEEAAIHALNEIVERDAWSLFLLSHFMGAPRKIGRLIDPCSMPKALQDLLATARERASGRQIFLIDITSDIGIPTFVATVDQILPEEPIYPQGFGTSTYPLYAAYRALTELIQDVDFKANSEDATRAGRINLKMVSSYSKIRDCVYFMVDIRRLDLGLWTYDSPTTHKHLTTVLADTLVLLKSSGIDVCFNVNHQIEDTLCVVTCVSIAMERFFLVSGGYLMAPGPRGKELFTTAKRCIPNGLTSDGDPR